MSQASLAFSPNTTDLHSHGFSAILTHHKQFLTSLSWFSFPQPDNAQFHPFSISSPLPRSCKTSRYRCTCLRSSSYGSNGGARTEKDETKGSGTTARGRRLLKLREEKRRRETDRLNNYPAWAKVLEDACKNDTELRAVLGDSIGDPELMRKKIMQRRIKSHFPEIMPAIPEPYIITEVRNLDRLLFGGLNCVDVKIASQVEERVRRKGRDFNKSKTGSVLSFKVSFRDFNPLDSFIWFELFGSPSDRDVDVIGSVIQSWYVMGRLGAFNSSNLQLANTSVEYDPLYDADKGSKLMPSSFHDISDVEFQDNWGRVWVDLGTADFFSIDVLLNCLTVLSSEFVGIQQVVFGGRSMGDWEEGMTSPEDGYKFFKI